MRRTTETVTSCLMSVSGGGRDTSSVPATRSAALLSTPLTHPVMLTKTHTGEMGLRSLSCQLVPE